MRHGKSLVLAALITTIVGCANNSKKEEDQNDKITSASSALFDTQNKVDLDKAARLNIELGMGYLKQEQISRAKSKFIRAKNLAPELPEVHYSYGYFLEYVGENKQAEKAYQKAIGLNSKGGSGHNTYGAFLCRIKQYEKAEKEFLKAVEDPEYTQTAQAFENAGMCVLQIPDVAKAQVYFEKALRYDPNSPNALIELAIMKYREGSIPFAKEYHQRYMQQSKPTARSLLLGIQLAKKQGDKNQEASYQMLLKSQFPNAKLADLYTPLMRS